MKHRILFPMVLAFAAFVVAMMLAACSGGSDSAGNSGESGQLPVLPPVDMYPPGYMAPNQAVTLKFEPSDESGTRAVFRIASEVDEQYMEEMAKKLGMEGKVHLDLSGDSPAYEVEDEDGTLTGFGVCVMYFSKRSGSGQRANLSEAEASEKAWAFLSEHGLLPEDADSGGGSFLEEGSFEIEFSHRSFPVVFNSFPYIFPLLIYLNLNPQGEVDNFIYCWPELEEVGKYPLLSEREAHEDMLSNPTESAAGASVSITSFVLSYLTATDGEDNSYIVPVYCAMGERHRDMGGDDEGCVAVVSAIPADLQRRGYPDWHSAEVWDDAD